jgi:hypothetical protein
MKRRYLMAAMLLANTSAQADQTIPLHPPYILTPLIFAGIEGPMIGNAQPGCLPAFDMQVSKDDIVHGPPICPGPYQNFMRSSAVFNHYEVMFTSMFFERFTSYNYILRDHQQNATPIAPPPTPGNQQAPVDKNTASTLSTGSDHGEMCPELSATASDQKNNDPKTVCKCTGSYLRRIADQAISLRDANPDVVASDPYFAGYLSTIGWVASLTQGDKAPGWKWRCDLLDHGPQKTEAKATLTAPERPQKGWFESKAAYSARMKEYGEKYREYMKQQMQGKAAQLGDNLHNDMYNRAIADIPDVAYSSIMGAMVLFEDMKEATYTPKALTIEKDYLTAEEKAWFTLWKGWQTSLHTVTIGQDAQGHKQFEAQGVTSAMMGLCKEYDSAVNEDIASTANRIRQIGKEVKAWHDPFMKELKLWADFSARDGFPKVGKDGKAEFYGGFMGLEPIFFNNTASLMLHPGFGSVMRPREADMYLRIPHKSTIDNILVLGGEILSKGEFDSNPDCHQRHLDVPAGFDSYLIDQNVQYFAAGDHDAASSAVLQGNYNTLLFWFDVLKANDNTDVYASGADKSEQP